MGHRIDAIISLKDDSEEAQTVVSENRYIYSRIDFVGGQSYLQVSFLVRQVPRTSATVLRYR